MSGLINSAAVLGVTVQLPIALPHAPILDNIALNLSATPASTKNATKRAGKKNDKKALPETSAAPAQAAPFLVSALPIPSTTAGEPDAATLISVQGSGIYYYSLQRQQSLKSWSVPPGVVFAAPATFVRSVESFVIDTAGTAIGGSKDAISDLEDLITGQVVVPIQSGNVGELWVWKCSRNENSVTTVTGSHKVVRCPKPVHNVFPLSDHSILAIVHTDGTITLADSSVETLGSWTPPSNKQQKVLFSTSDESTDSIITIIHDKVADAFFVRAVSASSISNKMRSSAVEQKISIPATTTPVSFAYQASTGALCVAFLDFTICLYTLDQAADNHQQLEASTILRLHSFYTNPHSMSLAFLSENYLSVVGTSQSSESSSKDTLTIWDTTYGTLQHTSRVAADAIETPASSHASKVYNGTVVVNSPLTGPTILSVLSSVKSRHPFTYSSYVSLIPYYCPKLTLLGALGKLLVPTLSLPTGQVIGVEVEDNTLRTKPLGMVHLPAAEAPIDDVETFGAWIRSVGEADLIEKEGLERLLHIKDAAKFELAFCSWVQRLALSNHKAKARPSQQDSKEARMPRHLKEPASAHLLRDLPKVPLTPGTLHLLIPHLLHNPVDFFPQYSLLYLLRTGNMASNEGTASSLVRATLQRGDMRILEELLHRMNHSLPASDLVQCLHYVLLTPVDSPALKLIFTSSVEEREKILQQFQVERKELKKSIRHDRMLGLGHGGVKGTPNVQRRRMADWNNEASDAGEAESEDDEQSDESSDEEETPATVEQDGHGMDVDDSTANGTVDDVAKSTLKPYQTHFLPLILCQPHLLAPYLKTLPGAQISLLLDYLRASFGSTVAQNEPGERSTHEADNGVAAYMHPDRLESYKEMAQLKKLENEDSSNLWWFLIPERKGHHLKPALSIRILASLIDGCLTTILRSPSLSSEVVRLQKLVSRETDAATLCVNKLRGVLSPFGPKDKPQGTMEKRNPKDKGHNKRWRRMVTDVEGEEYTVEVFRV
ncbi:hypothetical protein BC832DRAFT_589992 [Gaertneriomyces semiglobifer]|nr:hypothetical protein BC832DRAFT_589992 [Gaertneriomyces semiglobifer]